MDPNAPKVSQPTPPVEPTPSSHKSNKPFIFTLTAIFVMGILGVLGVLGYRTYIEKPADIASLKVPNKAISSDSNSTQTTSSTQNITVASSPYKAVYTAIKVNQADIKKSSWQGYSSKLNGSDKTEINLGLDDTIMLRNQSVPASYQFRNSPLGGYLTRKSLVKVDVSPANNPTAFKTLFQPSTEGYFVSEAIWSPDESKAFVYTVTSAGTQGYLMNPDGTNQQVVPNLPSVAKPFAINTKQNVYYSIELLSESSNAAIIARDLTTGQEKSRSQGFIGTRDPLVSVNPQRFYTFQQTGRAKKLVQIDLSTYTFKDLHTFKEGEEPRCVPAPSGQFVFCVVLTMANLQDFNVSYLKIDTESLSVNTFESAKLNKSSILSISPDSVFGVFISLGICSTQPCSPAGVYLLNFNSQNVDTFLTGSGDIPNQTVPINSFSWLKSN